MASGGYLGAFRGRSSHKLANKRFVSTKRSVSTPWLVVVQANLAFLWPSCSYREAFRGRVSQIVLTLRSLQPWLGVIFWPSGAGQGINSKINVSSRRNAHIRRPGSRWCRRLGPSCGAVLKPLGAFSMSLGAIWRPSWSHLGLSSGLPRTATDPQNIQASKTQNGLGGMREAKTIS